MYYTGDQLTKDLKDAVVGGIITVIPRDGAPYKHTVVAVTQTLIKTTVNPDSKHADVIAWKIRTGLKKDEFIGKWGSSRRDHIAFLTDEHFKHILKVRKVRENADIRFSICHYLSKQDWKSMTTVQLQQLHVAVKQFHKDNTERKIT